GLSVMDDNEISDIQENLEPARATDREGIPWGAAFLLVWAVILIVFAVQNAEDTSVQFLGWTWVMPVAMLVLVTALVTLVLTGLGASFYRRRRRKRRELRRAAGSDD
ncbi:MAG TPA: lipopolysaccharide assembly protein LapA domain-containing protein, partial [Acidimicrobiia bacterium]|nr:lipopolysaccharide assembly protein LapA domain-containing protein [Acidimicrobiia bacterium]